MSGSLPTVVTTAGLLPQTPAALNTQLINLVSATNPGYTVLPAGLIEDLSSTATAALVLIDQARVETFNSLTPYGCNAFILNQLGQQYGVPVGLTVNTSVYVVFSSPVIGYVIAPGFTVADSTYQYVVPADGGGVISSTGQSAPIYMVATQGGSWSVPANTVTTIVTSLPSGVTVTCTNPLAGAPSGGAETESNYRARVLTAGVVASVGTPAFVNTLLSNVSGVNQAQISILESSYVTGSWEVIVGGNGDPYQIAYALYRSIPNLGLLVGSFLEVSSVTQANPGVVTTLLNHGYTTGQVVTFENCLGMTELNTGDYTITVISEVSFSIGVSTSGYPAYTGGGIVLPNLRNVVVTINDWPNLYPIPFVIPPQQTVSIDLLWNTTISGFTTGPVVSSLMAAALINYVNNLPTGAPMNQFVMVDTVQSAVSSVLPTAALSRLVWTVAINDVSTAPETGTGMYYGDPESYFYATVSSVVVNQG